MSDKKISPEGEDVQKKLFNFIKKTLKNKSSLVVELMSILDLSKSGAYKKISGDSKLSFDDVLKLSRHYGFSIDQFSVDRTDPIPFQVDAIRRQPASYIEYLLNIYKHFQEIKAAKGVEIFYVTGEVPLFHYLQFPTLLYFKLYVWNNTCWHIPGVGRNFSLREFTTDEDLNALRSQMLEDYYSYDGMEMWNTRFLDITLDQLRYYAQSGIFDNKDDFMLIYKDLEKMCKYLKGMAEKGHKYLVDKPDELMGELKVQMHELVSSSNIIYVTADTFRTAFVTYDSPNFIKSSDNRFCDYTEQWIDSIVQHSMLISVEGERERERSFRLINKKMQRAKEELISILNYTY